MIMTLAQICPVLGDVEENIQRHLHWINIAIDDHSSAIFFPELSLSGYCPSLSADLVFSKNDVRFDKFQEVSTLNNIVIGLGVPLQADHGINISMVVFQPQNIPIIYKKQYLHADEKPFFISGAEPVLFRHGHFMVAPAICYESLQSKHIQTVTALGSNLYLASVAKPARVLEKAHAHYRNIAIDHKIPVCLVNSVGPAEDFVSAGRSAVWLPDGSKIMVLPKDTEGLIHVDL